MKAHSTRGQIEELRAALLDNGYQPVPVYGSRAGGKKPFGNKWQNATGMPKWHPDAPNTGINCRGLRAIDVDVDELDAEGIRALIVARLGPAPIRTRSNSGRSLLLYRAAEGEPGKRVVELDSKPPPPQGEKPPRVDKVEVLGKGQQVVAYGTHETDVPLEWLDTSPLDTPCGELTAVTEEQIEALLAEIFEQFATPAAKAARTGRVAGRRASARASSASSLVSSDSTREKARGALAALPNDYDHDEWLKLGMAIFKAGLSFEDWDRWSQQHHSYKRKRTRDAWQSFEKGGVRDVTEGTLFWHAGRRAPDWRKQFARDSQSKRRGRKSSTPSGGGDTTGPQTDKPGGDICALDAYALANPDRWLPELCPHAERREDGSWVIAADSDGLVLDEPVTVTSAGISGGRTPTTLVAEQLGMPLDHAAEELARTLRIEPPEPDDNAELRARSQAKRERQAALDEVYRDTSNRPLIRYHARSYTLAAEQSERAIMASGAEVFARGDQLVRPVTKKARGADGKPTTVAHLAKIPLPYMRQLMDRAAIYEKPGPEGSSKAFVPSPPPEEAAKLILNREGDWPFHEVVGVIAAPTLRPDGSVLDRPGYDQATGLYLASSLKLPPIPKRPTKDDALAALARLEALLCEFPFEDEASRSVGLSALVTPVVRGMFAHVPIHGFTAPTAGTGKSYLVDTASVIATGFRAAALFPGRKEEETEKRLDAALMEGAPILSLDNVNGRFSSEKLCLIATADRIPIRRFGKNDELPKVESRATTFLNGNNVGLSVELARRTLLARLDARMEKPHEREFQGDPVAEAMANRARYVADAITIVRAYLAAGQVSQTPLLQRLVGERPLRPGVARPRRSCCRAGQGAR
jgi:hypothetical protein